MTNQVSINTRYLLWSRQIARAEWQTWLTIRTSLPSDLLRRLVRDTLPDADLSSDYLRSIAEALDMDEENLRFADLPRDRCHVLAENLRFLFQSLGHGGKKVLAGKLGIDPTTVSRWLSGSYEPQPASLRQLVSEFGLPSETDLLEDPIFLSVEPISEKERRQWLNAQINELPPEELKDLFPALRRLLEPR
jgi:transcriptional regulator with XRE-family HTH domain